MYNILSLLYMDYINSFGARCMALVSGASSFPCRLLITFANGLDTDKARQKVGPDLDANCLTL